MLAVKSQRRENTFSLCLHHPEDFSWAAEPSNSAVTRKSGYVNDLPVWQNRHLSEGPVSPLPGFGAPGPVPSLAQGGTGTSTTWPTPGSQILTGPLCVCFLPNNNLKRAMLILNQNNILKTMNTFENNYAIKQLHN